MAWPNGTRYKTYAPGSSFPPADPNAIQDQILQVAGYRGVTPISATESRTNVAYGLLGTPDQIAGIVVPVTAKLRVSYQATWQEAVNGAARAAIFIGATQLKVSDSTAAAPVVQETSLACGTANIDKPLSTSVVGLASSVGVNPTVYGGDVTTGQVLTPVEITVAAGTYTISVQFKSTSGAVTVKNRLLLVETIPFA
jgi:hypothetical protein